MVKASSEVVRPLDGPCRPVLIPADLVSVGHRAGGGAEAGLQSDLAPCAGRGLACASRGSVGP